MAATQCQDSHPNMVGFTAADMAKTVAFYRDQLGFQLIEAWPDAQKPMWARLALAGQCVMFGQAMSPEACASMHKNPAAGRFWSGQAANYHKGPHGAGVVTYLHVPDIDAYAALLSTRGLKPELPPTTQFYGLRDLVVVDPDGYVLTFYTPVAMPNCQSCGMPLTDCKPGAMYCSYCADAQGQLHPYEQIFEGTVTGYFMAQQKLDRKSAEQAARAHLAKMPAWSHRK